MMGAGYMHTGYYFGFFLAAIANYYIGAHFGWRMMFALGGIPALLVTFIRYGVHESARVADRGSRNSGSVRRWREAFARAVLAGVRAAHDAEFGLSARVDRRAVGRVGVRADVSDAARAARRATPQRTRRGSRRTARWSSRSGRSSAASCCRRWPNRSAAARRWLCTSSLMFLSIAIGFGYVFYLPSALCRGSWSCLFFLGVGGANFAMYTLWLPEQYSTECRASAFAFATSVGRFAGAGITFLVGAGVAYYHTIGTPVAFTSIAFLIGLALLPFGEETRGSRCRSNRKAAYPVFLFFNLNPGRRGESTSP